MMLKQVVYAAHLILYIFEQMVVYIIVPSFQVVLNVSDTVSSWQES